MEINLAGLRDRRRKCLACDAEALGDAEPVLAAGVDLVALDDYLPAWPLCTGCQARERSSVRRARWLQVALGLGPPAVGLGVAILGPFDLALAPTLGAALGAAVSVIAVRASGRMLARRLPVIVVGAHPDRVELLRLPRPSVDEHAGPYRSAPASAWARGRPVAIGGGMWAAFLGAAVFGVLAWILTAFAYPRVRFDNASPHDMQVEVDGRRTVLVSARDSVETSLRHGSHTFRVRYADEVTDGELLQVSLPFGKPHLLSVDASGCFVRSHTSESRIHRGSRVVSSSLITTCGRWVPMGYGTISRTTRSPDDISRLRFE